MTSAPGKPSISSSTPGTPAHVREIVLHYVGNGRIEWAAQAIKVQAAGRETPRRSDQLMTMPGSVMAWPASGTMRRSASGQARFRSQAFFTGVTTS